MLHLLPNDIGRPIGDINNRMKIVDFEKILLEALDNVVIKEQQVQDEHGRVVYHAGSPVQNRGQEN